MLIRRPGWQNVSNKFIWNLVSILRLQIQLPEKTLTSCLEKDN